MQYLAMTAINAISVKVDEVCKPAKKNILQLVNLEIATMLLQSTHGI